MGYYGVQGHSRSSRSVPLESPNATSYQSSYSIKVIVGPNKHHFLHYLLPPPSAASQSYNLRRRPHTQGWKKPRFFFKFFRFLGFLGFLGFFFYEDRSLTHINGLSKHRILLKKTKHPDTEGKMKKMKHESHKSQFRFEYKI